MPEPTLQHDNGACAYNERRYEQEGSVSWENESIQQKLPQGRGVAPRGDLAPRISFRDEDLGQRTDDKEELIERLKNELRVANREPAIDQRTLDDMGNGTQQHYQVPVQATLREIEKWGSGLQAGQHAGSTVASQPKDDEVQSRYEQQLKASDVTARVGPVAQTPACQQHSSAPQGHARMAMRQQPAQNGPVLFDSTGGQWHGGYAAGSTPTLAPMRFGQPSYGSASVVHRLPLLTNVSGNGFGPLNTVTQLQHTGREKGRRKGSSSM
ncbi:hypothetical protein LTR86_001513 [Recurvomyces mirabilis]|nr:hypothetical protein LTR86_001513 [Recurvomyces mirabilis]